MNKKIYYHDTDCGGVVYYSNYLKYFEEARTEYLDDKEVSVKSLSDEGILFVVRKVEISYKAPARYSDNILILTEINKIKNVSLDFSQSIKREETILVIARTQLVCVDRNFSPVTIPQNVASRLNT